MPKIWPVKAEMADRIFRLDDGRTLRLDRHAIWSLECRFNGHRFRVSTGERDLAAAKQYAAETSFTEPVRYEQYPKLLNDCVEAFAAAAKRAGKFGMSYTLSKADVDRVIQRAWGRCEVTGIDFDWHYKVEGAHKPHPFMPSVDRIDHQRGYEPDNVRLVCIAANMAMNQWGEDVLTRMAAAMVLTGKLDVKRLRGSRIPSKKVRNSYAIAA